MVLGATAALVLYGIGLHGAQKRNEKALAFYGTSEWLRRGARTLFAQ